MDGISLLGSTNEGCEQVLQRPIETTPFLRTWLSALGSLGVFLQAEDRNEWGEPRVRQGDANPGLEGLRLRQGRNKVFSIFLGLGNLHGPDLSRPSSPQCPQPEVVILTAAPCSLNGTQDSNFVVPEF